MIVRRPSPNVADPTWNDLVMKAVRSDHYNMEGRMLLSGALRVQTWIQLDPNNCSCYPNIPFTLFQTFLIFDGCSLRRLSGARSLFGVGVGVGVSVGVAVGVGDATLEPIA